MNILILAHRVPFPPNKGEKIRTYNQIAYFVKHGHAITVLCLVENPQDINSASELQSSLGIRVKTVQIGYRFVRLLRGLLTRESLTISNFYVFRLQKELDNILARDRFDVILCTGSGMANYIHSSGLYRRNRMNGTKLVMDFMDLDSDKWLQYAKYRNAFLTYIYRRESKLLEIHENNIYNTFDDCLFVSEIEERMLKVRVSDSQGRIHTISNGVDSNLFYPARERTRFENNICFLFTGVMDYYPNEDAMVWFVTTIWGEIVSRWPHAQLKIVGMKPTKKIKALSKFNGIEVTGSVVDILPYYHRADIFIAPFRLARGIQNKILESFASGVPVLATSIAAEGIECRDREHLLITESKDDFINATQELLDSHFLYNNIKKNAMKLVHDTYCWDKQTSNLLRIMESH